MTALPDANLLSNRSYFLGVDVGGTNIRALLVDQDLNSCGWVSGMTDVTSTDRTVDSIARAIDQVLESANVPADRVRAVGLGVPGQVQAGVVKMAVNLNLESYPLASELSERFGLPFELENDGRTAAMGAYRLISQRKKINHLAYLSIGTGISAGLILNGLLYRGSNGMAGEIGHMVVEPQGPLCPCGAWGCLEALAAGPAIAREAQNAVERGELTMLGNYDPITPQVVFKASQLDDPVAVNVIQRSSYYLSRAIQWLVMTYDVEMVVLGGGVSHAGDAFLLPVLNEIEKIRSQSDLAANMLSRDKVILLPSDYDAGVWGAIVLAQKIAQKSYPAARVSLKEVQ